MKFHLGLKVMQAGGQMATINDETFVQGIQFLIKEGILKVPQSYQSNTSTGAEPEAWYD